MSTTISGLFRIIKDKVTKGRILWVLVTLILTGLSYTVGTCQTAASIAPRVDVIEASVLSVDTRLTRVQQRVDQIEPSLVAKDQRIKQIEERLHAQDAILHEIRGYTKGIAQHLRIDR
jgi:hypothetical protein